MRFLALVMIISLFVGVMPAIAGGAPTSTEAGIFQKSYKSMSEIGEASSGKDADAWTTVFQKATNNIGTWDDKVGNTKSSSLRNDPAELMRRRGIKK